MTRPRPIRLLRLEDRLTPAIATWDGGGANNMWMTAANWVGDVAPNSGDDLVFPAGAAQLTNVNDFVAGMAFQSIGVTASGYQISGNSVSLTAGVSANIPNAGVSTLSLVIGGGGGLTKAGAGTLALSGANTYAGITNVSAGFLEVDSSAALGAVGAGNNTIVGDGSTLAFRSVNAVTTMTVGEAITFSGQGAPALPSGLSGALFTTQGTIVLSGLLTLAGDSQTVTGSSSELRITQGINEIGGARALRLAGTRTTFAATAVNTYTGPTTVVSNVFFFGRGVSQMLVQLNPGNNGTLQGSGTVGPVQVNGGAIVAGIEFDGHTTPQTFTLGGLSLSSDSSATLTGTPTGADKFVVHGAVQLAGTLNFFSGIFPFQSGTRLTLIDNDGSDAVQGTFTGLPEGFLLNSQPVPFRITYHGGDGNDVQLIATSVPASAVGAGAGGLPVVNVYDSAGGLVRTIMAYDSAFHGGVRVATIDVTGDTVLDVITAPGPGGGPVVRIWDGASGAMIRQFNAYDPNFRGGVFLATAILDVSTSAPDIITGAGAGGGPHVKVFDARNGSTLASFLAYDPSFLGGVSVAAFSGIHFFHDGGFSGVIVTGAGPGGAPHVRSFSNFGQPLTSFFAYDTAFHGGVNVAAHGTVLSDSPADQHVVTAPASNGGPDVRIYNLAGQRLGGFVPYAPSFFGGVTIAVNFVPTTGFGVDVVIMTGAGPGGGPHVEWWTLATNNTVTLRRSFFAFDPAFLGGVFVG